MVPRVLGIMAWSKGVTGEGWETILTFTANQALQHPPLLL